MSIEDRIGSAIRYRDGSYVMRLSENFATADNQNQIFYAESDPNNNAAAYVSSNGNLFTFLFLILGLVLLVVLIGILLAQFFVYRRGLKQEEEYLRMCRRYDKQLNTPAVNRKGSQRSLSKKNSKKDFADSFMNQSNNAAPVVAYGGYNNNNAIPQTNSTVASNRDYYNSAFNPLQPYGANNNTNNNGYDYNANVNIYSTTSNNTTSAAAPAYDPYGTSGTGYGGYNNNNTAAVPVPAPSSSFAKNANNNNNNASSNPDAPAPGTAATGEDNSDDVAPITRRRSRVSFRLDQNKRMV